MPSYETFNGLKIRYDAPARVRRFVSDVASRAESPKATENDLVSLIYSADNPILERSAIGTPTVTKETLANPVYRVLQDLLERKRLADRGITADELAKGYTISVTEAAEQLGIHESAVRQAITNGRLAAWCKDGRYFLHPKWLEQFRIATEDVRRGPKAKAKRKPMR